MKVLTVLGARPQIIKAAHLTHWLLEAGVEEVMVHSGQHFSPDMSGAFFAEFQLSEPRYNLGVNRVSRATMIGKILYGLDEILQVERPDACIVYGDTNTTLAGALGAEAAGVPVVHIEAGLRSGNRRMPEESNRILVDQISSLNLAPDRFAMNNLDQMSLSRTARLTGDIMIDSVVRTVSKIEESELVSRTGVLVTLHREHLTADHHEMRRVLSALSLALPLEVITIVRHPRLSNRVMEGLCRGLQNVAIVEPLSHRSLLTSALNSALIVTDSGGLQREAAFLGLNCIVARGETEWLGQLENGTRELIADSIEAIEKQVRRLYESGKTSAFVGKFSGPKEAIGSAISTEIVKFLGDQSRTSA